MFTPSLWFEKINFSRGPTLRLIVISSTGTGALRGSALIASDSFFGLLALCLLICFLSGTFNTVSSQPDFSVFFESQ